MTLIIAILLLINMNAPWWWYPIIFVCWVVRLMLLPTDETIAKAVLNAQSGELFEDGGLFEDYDTDVL